MNSKVLPFKGEFNMSGIKGIASLRREQENGLLYGKYDRDVTWQMLNEGYGEYGMTFDTEEKARRQASLIKGARVHRLFNYWPQQLDSRGKVIPGSSPHVIGWHVVYPSKR